MKNKIIQFVKFGIVGMSNTAISYIIYVIFVALKVHYMIASVAGFVLSVLNAFYWNNKYVFRAAEEEKRVWWKTLVKTFLSYAGTGLVLSNLLLFMWIEGFGISSYIAPIINLCITIPLNFILNKYWAFRNK